VRQAGVPACLYPHHFTVYGTDKRFFSSETGAFTESIGFIAKDPAEAVRKYTILNGGFCYV